MQKKTQHFILITGILMLASSGIYFLVAYGQMHESNDIGSQIQTMLFTTAAITYLPLGIWMFKNKLHSRAPYVIASLISITLIGLYVISRSVNLPIVGIQQDVGSVDVISKIIQISIIALSTFLILNWKKEKIILEK